MLLLVAMVVVIFGCLMLLGVPLWLVPVLGGAMVFVILRAMTPKLP